MPRRPFALLAPFLILLGLYTIHRLPTSSNTYLLGQSFTQTRTSEVPTPWPESSKSQPEEPKQVVIGGNDAAGGFEAKETEIKLGSEPTQQQQQRQQDEEVVKKTQGNAQATETDKKVHPMVHLIRKAEKDAEEMVSRQSATLEEAVAEYRRRYGGMPPPPGFDSWFEFASARDVVLLDEFDAVHEMLTPYWGLKPATLRRRTREALGYDNMLLGGLVRGGNLTLTDGGSGWERAALVGMMGNFVQFLPDMDIAFNLHDEPRVILQHDDLSRLVAKAKDGMAAAARVLHQANAFTPPPASEDMGDGKFIEEVGSSRFNKFPRQQTWSTSRMSCPPTSPARALEEEDEILDDTTGYCSSSSSHSVCFIHNLTAFTDICTQPSLRTSHGFFDRPNAYSVSHDLVPVFSSSKLSTYADIVYPSPWYWVGKVAYNATADDAAWEEKMDDVFWRGSTTGGFSRWGAWRRHHRQRIVDHVNGFAVAGGNSPPVLLSKADDDGGAATWQPATSTSNPSVVRLSRQHVNVSFSHVGQCDPGDCAAQLHHFAPLSDRTPQDEAWRSHKLVLDMDGNAFSGRFQAFVRSRSLVLKFGLFREWWSPASSSSVGGGGGGWLVPWRHFVPLSLAGGEWAETVRFLLGVPVEGGRGEKGELDGEEVDEGLEEGRREAKRMAEAGTEWAEKVLRKVDMEAWFFRLLLEYARVIDDNRESIGFSL